MTILTLDIGGSEIKAAHYQTDGSCSKTLPNHKTAVSALRLSLSPILISSKDTESFSLMIGTTPSSTSVKSVFRILSVR